MKVNQRASLSYQMNENTYTQFPRERGRKGHKTWLKFLLIILQKSIYNFGKSVYKIEYIALAKHDHNY